MRGLAAQIEMLGGVWIYIGLGIAWTALVDAVHKAANRRRRAHPRPRPRTVPGGAVKVAQGSIEEAAP